MKARQILLLAATFCATTSVDAAGIGVRAGTTGVGVDFGWTLAPTLSARIGYSGLGYKTTIEESDISYDTKLTLSNLSAFLDWSPLGPFRITAGIVGNGNKADLTGTPTGGTFTINGVPYNAADVGTLSGSVEPGRSAAPYLGIGYGNVAGAGVNFYFDLGVIFQGAPTASLSASCGPALPPAQCTQIRNDLAAEQQQLQEQLDKYKVFPVLSLGVTVGF
ncbi:MAG: hypothetical protein OEV81_13075 [Betaproteobacteria bacterium]|nr:hypothetical protein [Betaproteobacteria bacterium]MDH5222124.1 hypothetical protein [Betaproteobacteria bacterium]MDH5351981.1 hypothetical protein [Betaproteobacteria bacterium]